MVLLVSVSCNNFQTKTDTGDKIKYYRNLETQ